MVLNNVVSEEDADYMINNRNNLSFDHPIIKSILSKCSKLLKKELKPSFKSYLSVERATNGHDWHTDKGTNGHMSWCRYGISILLSNPLDIIGGIFRYREPKEEITPKKHYLNAVIHESSKEHMVEPSNNRAALLIFLGTMPLLFSSCIYILLSSTIYGS